MLTDVSLIEASLQDVAHAQSRITRIKSNQVRNGDDRDYLKSVAYKWFQTYRPYFADRLPIEELDPIDTQFAQLLEATERAATKAIYQNALKCAKVALVSLRSASLTPTPLVSNGNEVVPDFSPLAADPAMKGILERRWVECQQCIGAGASLAATVMMGGLLEALFVARANLLPAKTPLFNAKTTPIDKKTGKPLALTDWTLRPYIDVGAELGWITRSGKDVAAVLRDYRNYVHPEKERSHGVALNSHDSSIFWGVTKSLTRQLLASAAKP